MPTHTDLNYNTIDFSKKKSPDKTQNKNFEIIRIIKKKDRDIQNTKKKIKIEEKKKNFN